MSLTNHSCEVARVQLLGKLVAYWQIHYPQRAWIDYRCVADGSADLPGAVSTKALSLKARLPTIYSVTMTQIPSLMPQSISRSSKHSDFPSSQAWNHTNVTAFPPLLSKQPLLGGSWNASVFQDVHPFSHIHRRRRQLPPDDTTTTISPPPQICQWPNTNIKRQPRAEPRSPLIITNIPRSADPKASEQRPFIHNIGKKTNLPTRKILGTDLSSQRPKQLKVPSNPARPQLTGSFIRSVTVHSRRPAVLPTSGFVKGD